MQRRHKRRLAMFFGIPVLALCGFMIAGTFAAVGLATETTDPTTITTTTPQSPCFDIVLDDPSNANHVSLCHFTGGTNIVLNEPSVQSLGPHTTHHGDCYKLLGQPQVRH